MNWVERQTDTGASMNVTPEKAATFEQAKGEGLPVIEKEAARGQMPLDPIRFTPVKSPGIYEAEFGKKDGSVIFHFWPWGFHQAQRDEKPTTPRFHPKFEHYMKVLIVSEFVGSKPEFHEDPDMGAWCVVVPGWGEKQFFHEIAVKACERLHYALGGT